MTSPEFIPFICGFLIGGLIGLAIAGGMAYNKIQDLYIDIAKYKGELRHIRRKKDGST